MSQPNLVQEASNPPEPLLPVEKKLIGWSLGLGIGLLIILVIINRYIPVAL